MEHWYDDNKFSDEMTQRTRSIFDAEKLNIAKYNLYCLLSNKSSYENIFNDDSKNTCISTKRSLEKSLVTKVNMISRLKYMYSIEKKIVSSLGGDISELPEKLDYLEAQN